MIDWFAYVLGILTISSLNMAMSVYHWFQHNRGPRFYVVHALNCVGHSNACDLCKKWADHAAEATARKSV